MSAVTDDHVAQALAVGKELRWYSAVEGRWGLDLSLGPGQWQIDNEQQANPGTDKAGREGSAVSQTNGDLAAVNHVTDRL